MKHSLLMLAVLTATVNLTACGKKAEDPDKKVVKKSQPPEDFVLYNDTRDIREAVVLGKLETVREIIAVQRDLNINKIYEDGDTLLTTAIKYEQPEILELLLEKGADISKVDLWGNTTLMVAAKKGSGPLVRMILAVITDTERFLNQKNQAGDTALIVAIKNKQEQIALLLINSGSDTELKDKNQQDAKTLADLYEVTEVSRLLKSKEQIKTGAPDKDSFLNILKLGSAEGLEDVMTRHPEVLEESKDENLLVLVLENPDNSTAVKMTQLLLDKRISADGPLQAETTPIIEAIKQRRMYFVKIYLAANANLNKRDKNGKTPLIWAIETNNQMAVRNLLAYSAIREYSFYTDDGKRVTFRACEVAKATKKSLQSLEDRKNMDEIMVLLNCNRFSFL